MKDFHYYTPTDYTFGRGAELQVAAKAAEYGASKVLIVYGGGSAVKSGLMGRVETAMKEAGLPCFLLGGIKPNPTDDRVREGLEICRDEGIDLLVAVGGGSVIDTCKAIAVGFYYSGDVMDIYTKKAVPAKALPIGVVLTIPASGSEGSNSSVITFREGQRKIGINYDIIRPRFALLNPELTFTLPPYQTACGITDMMAHIMERYFTGTPHCELTDALAQGALRTIAAQGLIVMDEPRNYETRANLMWAGTLAHNGTFGAGREEDWASHRMEHELSARYGVAHGAGLAVIFPAWLTYVTLFKPAKVAQYAREVWDVKPAPTEAETAHRGIECLKHYLTSIGMPVSLNELLPGQKVNIDLLIKGLQANMGDTVGNYVHLSMKECARIYELAQ